MSPTINHLNLLAEVVARPLCPPEKVMEFDHLKLVASKLKTCQARIDLHQLSETGNLQRLGAGPATVYVRTSKEVPALIDQFQPG